MTFLRNYIFPALFGLLIYTSIRLVTDSMSHQPFWERSLQQNFIEICFSILLGIIGDRLLQTALARFNRRRQELCIQNVLREFGMVCLMFLAMFNPVLYLVHYLIHDPVDWGDFIIGNMMVLLYALLYYAIVRGNSLLRSYVEQQTQIEKIKNEQLQTELKFLKAQYHPHFLFNALNTIYFQMDENVGAAKQTVERFSELLRYQLYDHHQKLPVQRELDYLRNFIYLQKTRTSDKLNMTMEVEEGISNEKIYPLLFLPLVENAFKYVGGDYRLNIEVKRETKFILLRVDNSIPDVSSQSSGGIGLENLKRRLELLYPNAHSLCTEKQADRFIAVLKIPLYEN